MTPQHIRPSGESWADAATWFEDKAPYTHGFNEFYCERELRRFEEIHITLVHGTFAREAAWVAPDSPLAKRLVSEGAAEGIRVHVHPYRWSGSLSFRARKTDAIGLHDHLVGLVNAHPHAAHCAAAHSHGGTILMQALGADVDLQGVMHRVLCISTPFLRLKARPFEEQGAIKRGISMLAYVVLVLAILSLRAAPMLEPVFTSAPILAAAGLLALLLVMLRGAQVLVDKAFERWKRASQRTFNMTTHPQLRRDQSLLMRTAADEAGFVLGVGATLAWAIERFGATLSAIAELPTAIAELSQRLFVRYFSQPALVHLLAVLVVVNGVAVVTALFCVLLPVPSLQTAAMAFLVVLALMAAPGFVLLMSSLRAGAHQCRIRP